MSAAVAAVAVFVVSSACLFAVGVDSSRPAFLTGVACDGTPVVMRSDRPHRYVEHRDDDDDANRRIWAVVAISVALIVAVGWSLAPRAGPNKRAQNWMA